MGFFRDGDLAPLAGSGVNEMVLKALFLSILFEDTYYQIFSEPELDKTYAGLCLLVRPEMRRYGFFDLLFELKLVRRKELGVKGRELAGMDEAALAELPGVAKALTEARRQVEGYRPGLSSGVMGRSSTCEPTSSSRWVWNGSWVGRSNPRLEQRAPLLQASMKPALIAAAGPLPRVADRGVPAHASLAMMHDGGEHHGTTCGDSVRVRRIRDPDSSHRSYLPLA